MKFWIALIAAASGIAVTGCNTMAGAGEDIARGGEKIQDASKKVRADWRASRDRNEREYDAARATCAGTSGPQRDVCMDRARGDYSTRMKESRTMYRNGDWRANTEQERMDDAYDAARERCEGMRGSDEDACLADARTRYRR